MPLMAFSPWSTALLELVITLIVSPAAALMVVLAPSVG
jgi:hypothetical protein